MTKTHEAAIRLSPGTAASKPPDGQNKTSSPTIATGEEVTEIRDVVSESSENSDSSEEEGEGYTNGDPQSKSFASGNKRANESSSNYAMGNQCLDSGMLLRQGISLWGRSSSPADAVTVEAMTTSGSANAAQAQPSLSTQSGPGAMRSYVNLQSTKPSAARTPIGKQQQTSQAVGTPGTSPAAGGLRKFSFNLF